MQKKLTCLVILWSCFLGLMGWEGGLRTGLGMEVEFDLGLVRPVAAADLGSLPLGSVIQIMGTDTGMCDNSGCTSENSPVLPYRFVKMQAHRINTSGGDELVGGNGNCNSGNCAGYSYFMFMDNYCWWGSADCINGYNAGVNGTKSAVYQAFNGNCSGWNGTDCDGTALYTLVSNNISQPKSNNILAKLANFYNSLPANIGGKAKSAALANYNWEMIGVTTNPTGVPAAGPQTAGWTAGNYTSAGFTFNFSGGNTVASPPVMTARIGLLSYTEWQGGLYGYSDYPQIPGGDFNSQTFHISQIGSGSTFCKSRFNAYNCNLNLNGEDNTYPNSFNAENSFTYRNDDGVNVTLAVNSAANPRIRHPWFRAPRAGDMGDVWTVSSYSVTLSAGTNNALNGSYGVSPTLWLASDIAVVGEGEGSYEKPFCLNGGYCQSELKVLATSSSAAGGINLSGTVNGAATNQNLLVQAAVCNGAGNCVLKSTDFNTGDKNEIQGWNLNWSPTELPSGSYAGTIWVKAVTDNGAIWLASAQSSTVNFNIAPRILELTVVKNRAFNLVLGDAGIFNLTTGTNQGVTVAVDTTTNQLSVSGTLTNDAQITFGSAILKFTTLAVPESNMVETTLQ